MSKDNRQGQIPPRPTGSGRSWTFFGRVWDKVFGPEGRILDTPTVTVDYTTKGIKLNAKASAAGVGSSTLQCVITQLYGAPGVPCNYIGVTQFNLTTMALVGNQFFAAKCITGRQPTAETIDGIPVTYTGYNGNNAIPDYADNTRIYNSATEPSQFQVMNPRYMLYPASTGLQAGFDIGQFLVEVETLQNPVGILDANGAQITFLEKQPFRNWCYSAQLNGGND